MDAFFIAEQHLHRAKGFLLFIPPHQQGDWGWKRHWEGDSLIPTDPRDIAHQVASCSVYKAGEEEGRGEMFSCLSKSVSWGSALVEMAEPHGKAVNKFLALLVCVAFALSIKIFLSEPHFFFTVIFLILTPLQ